MKGVKSKECKECGVVFSEQNPKYKGNSLCLPCYRQYMRERNIHIPKVITDEFKLDNRKDIYQQKRKELSALKDRDEWRALISKRLDETLYELNKHLTYDRN